MSTTEQPMPVAAADKPAGAKPKTVKEKKPKASKEKKAAPQHPSYFLMIKEAIVAVKDRGGLSPYAIAKYMDGKYKNVLPANYKKTLTVQLRNCVARGKLIKVKGSFKLSEASKKVGATKKVATKKAGVKKVSTKKVSTKKVATKKVAPKEVKETKKRKKPASVGAAAKKPKKAMAKKVKKATPVKPKSIKSSAAKRAKKMAA